MCIALYKPEGKTISKETLQECFANNSDGAGFVYVKDGKLVMEKGFFTFDSFYDAYLPHMEHQALIHFRIKTHGAVDETNCHPFMITKNFAFIHNGTISGHGEKNFSDTYMFNEEILKPLVNQYGIKALWQPFMQTLMEDYIGWSKLIFLDSKGNYIIYNEAKGEWADGVWYSNTSYKPRVTYTTKGHGNTTHYPNKIDTRKDFFNHNINPSEQTWYLHRQNGFHIYDGDWVVVNKDLQAIAKDDLVEVVKIHSTGYATVRDTYGITHYGIQGSALDYTNFQSDVGDTCGVPTFPPY